MPSAAHSKGNSPEGQPPKAEPELTLSTRTKISMLPDLRRRKLQEQQNTSTEHNGQAETVIQSFDQPGELSQAASDTYTAVKRKTATRYTISSRFTAPSAAASSSPADSITKMSEEGPPVINHHRKPSYVVNVTNFDTHRGETATTRPPLIEDDLLSRLEGLRQFKEWSARIHDSAPQEADTAPEAASQYPPAPTISVHPVERHQERVGIKACSARIEHDLPLRHDSELLETNIDAPTPFPSPQVTPVPLGTAHIEQRSRFSASPPGLNLSLASSQDTLAHVRPTGHSRTVIISSESSNLQLAPRSRSTSQTRSDGQVPRRANSKPRSHPPVSFPKDFYERFPPAEEVLASTQEQQYQGRANSSPGVSPKITLSKLQDNQDISEDIERLATSHDEQVRPTFHNTTHYFTNCPHNSPPANRPLDPNAQPRLDLDYHSLSGTTGRCVIPGACFDCDVFHRRNEEDSIINANATQIAQLTNELARILDELELDQSDDEEADYLHDRHSARLLTSSTFAEDKYDLDVETEGVRELPPLSDDPEITSAARLAKLRTIEQNSYLNRVIKQVRHLEAQIDNLRDEQDQQIKKIWSGFTPRWGPATLGVQRGRQVTSVHRGTSSEREQTLLQNPGSVTTSGADEVQIVTADAIDQDLGVAASSFGGSSVISDGTSRDRSGSSRSRSGARTPATTSSVSTRDVPGSRTPGEGKMRIGWIREEKD